ncbi:hypothetical protein C5167_050429 [Papaver somniferum]|uniref:Uncharacterized protein n=1 Tax=Papaver somniferum TaxID=3469 RepID=A0A4Y7KRH5_PAPSO|nr:hypothetical protein C5167_050429 [Papaver somniferum]
MRSLTLPILQDKDNSMDAGCMQKRNCMDDVGSAAHACVCCLCRVNIMLNQVLAPSGKLREHADPEGQLHGREQADPERQSHG